MPDSSVVTKAELIELDANGHERGKPVTVQFNPETLKLSYSNQIEPPSQSEKKEETGSKDTATTQFVGKGTTKLSVQLWFDVNGVLPTGKEQVTDVRTLTGEVIYFIQPRESEKDPGKKSPPALSFRWGTFRFDGIVDSLEESLEFFSADGAPLRASISLSISQQSIEFHPPKRGTSSSIGNPLGGPLTGTRPLTQATAGDSLQRMASIAGRSEDWQAIAAANGIDDPRHLRVGQMIDLNLRVGTNR